MKKETKEIIIDLSKITNLYDYYKLVIEKMELPEFTGMSVDAMSDFLREPWEEDRNVRFIGVSKTKEAVKQKVFLTEEMFYRVKEFQAYCGNEFTWSIEQ